MGVGFHLNQSSATLHCIEPGQSLWAFTRRPDGQYVIAAELVCHQKTMNPEGFRYGPYRIWGDIQYSRYFDVNQQKDLTTLVRSFDLATGQAGKPLGQAFQGKAAVRAMANEEHLKLKAWTQNAVLEPRAVLLNEDLLEREMYDFTTLYQQLGEFTDLPISEERKTYLSTRSKVRRSGITKKIKQQYAGRCQVTGWDPRQAHDRDLCEAHHVHWLSRGGDDDIHNLVLLSPNIHRLIHSTDAPFDYATQSFIVNNQTLSLKLADHEIKPSGLA